MGLAYLYESNYVRIEIKNLLNAPCIWTNELFLLIVYFNAGGIFPEVLGTKLCNHQD